MKFSEVEHVKDVLWYDDVADISLPVEMIPRRILRKVFLNGDATMMLVLFDNTTSSDTSMEA